MVQTDPADACRSCPAYQTCLISQLAEHEQHDFLKTIYLQKKVKQGKSLAIQGSSSHYIYLIQSGLFKVSVQTTGGIEQIIGFKHAGDVIGLDGIFKEKQPSNAVALDDAIVCTISIHDLKNSGNRHIVIRDELLKKLQNEITGLSHTLVMLNQMNSLTKVVFFILTLLKKNMNTEMTSTQLRLAMSRSDIGSYLGLRIETVSRKLAELEKVGLIKIERRSIKIEKLDGLLRFQTEQQPHIEAR